MLNILFIGYLGTVTRFRICLLNIILPAICIKNNQTNRTEKYYADMVIISINLNKWTHVDHRYISILPDFILLGDIDYEETPGAHPTKDISTEIQWHFAIALFITYSANHSEMLHRSWQWYGHGVCMLLLWSVGHMLSTVNFERFSNSIETSLVGWASVPKCLNAPYVSGGSL